MDRTQRAADELSRRRGPAGLGSTGEALPLLDEPADDDACVSLMAAVEGMAGIRRAFDETIMEGSDKPSESCQGERSERL